MKKLAKLISLVLVLTLIGSVCLVAFATEPPAIENGYYLVGIINGQDKWTPSAEYKLAENPGNPGELMKQGITLRAGDQLKIASVTNEGTAYIPDGGGNHYDVEAAYYGTVDIYARPEGNHSGWTILGGRLWINLITAAGSGEFTYSPCTGTATDKASFTKTLQKAASAVTPAVTFTYNIGSGSAVPATASTFAVYAGVGSPTVGSAVYAAGEAGTTSIDKTVNVSFEGVTFNEPGIYRYAITEADNDVSGVSHDTTTRYLDVYIVDSDDNSHTLSIGGYVLHTDTSAPLTGATPTNKSEGFISTYAAQGLTVALTVSGNQASRDKFFTITVEIENAGANTVLPVDLSNAVVSFERAVYTNPTSLQCVDGKVTGTFYLQHGNSIIINGLPNGAKFTVTENAEDYTAAATITVGSGEPASYAGTEQTMGEDAVTIAFVNSKSGTVPTGILLTVAPFAGMMLLGAAGIVFLSAKKRKED